MRSFLGTRVLAFSPDSRSLLCCGLSIDSLTNFIVSWDVQTGGMVRVREIEEEAKGCPSAVTLSADGDMIGVAYFDCSAPNEFIVCVYEIDSGRRVYAHSFGGWFIKIWTYDQSLRFAAAWLGTITVWEIGLTPDPRSEPAETLDLPPNFSPFGPVSFLPDIHRLAYVVDNAVFIFDARNDELLLTSEDASFCGSMIAFSSDGHLFACGTTGPDIYLWEESSTGYTPHQKAASSTLSPVPLFSPDDTSFITWDSSTIQLWLLGGPTDPPHINGPPDHFLLDFSPGGGSAVVARRKSNTVAVFDLQAGVQRLTIDTGMEVYGLRVFGDTVVVEGRMEFVTWILPVGDSVPGAVTSVESSIRRTTVRTPRRMQPQSASISPDFLLIAARGSVCRVTDAAPLSVRKVSTGEALAMIPAAGDMTWFSQDGSQTWCDGEVGEEQGWRVLKDNGSTQAILDPLPIGNPPEGYPWRSSRGFTVTDDGWILGPGGERLLWLPPRWMSYERRTRVWSGSYLALLNSTLTEPVILKLEQ